MKRYAMLLVPFLGLAPIAKAQEAAKPVKLLTVTAEDAGNQRQFFGKVAARQTVDLAFQVGGQIVAFPAVEGSVTPKGRMIAQLDLEAFELALEQARLQRDQADRLVERYQRLQGAAVSEVSLEDAITDASLAEVAVRRAQKDLRDATMLAPFDALIAERMTDNFTTISAGNPVVRLHDMSELRIEIDVPEVLFQRAGTDPDVTVSAQFPASDEVFPLELREFNAETSSVGQTFQLTFGMPPPEGLRILPGSSVKVLAVLNDDRSDLLVPATALVPGRDGTLSAFLFEPEKGNRDLGRLRRVTVDVEPIASGQMRVLGGLEAGDEIVAMGADAMEDGQQVRRFLGFGQ